MEIKKTNVVEFIINEIELIEAVKMFINFKINQQVTTAEGKLTGEVYLNNKETFPVDMIHKFTLTVTS